MKTIRIFSLILLTAGLLSCERKVQFNDAPFVAFDQTSVLVNEDAGVIELGVTATSCTSPFSLTFVTEDDTAVSGIFYEVLENPAQILNFTNDAPTQVIKIEIKNQAGVFTGGADFAVKLSAATAGVGIVGNSACSITINDLDHPLSDILGSYTGQGNDAFGRAASYAVSISPDKNDVTKIWLNPVVPFFVLNGITGDLSVYGFVSDDHKTITLPFGQDTVERWNGAEDWMYLTGWVVDGSAPAIDDSPTEVKFVWNDAAGGFVNSGRFCLAGRSSGKLGNYYWLYWSPDGLLLKKN